MKITFNTIFTPGSVKYLQLFVFSWLKGNEFGFRLISNGCSQEEVRILKALSDKDDRLEFLELPFKEVAKHGDALNYLQSVEKSEYFCFMDTDILCVDSFEDEVVQSLQQYSGFFSGAAIWITDEEEIFQKDEKKMRGRFNRTTSGTCLGSTYFAIYNNHILSQLMKTYGMSFSKYVWKRIPLSCQEQIAHMGLKCEKYDAGKVLNLLFLAQGHRLTYEYLPTILHIGGISSFCGNDARPQTEDIRKAKGTETFNDNLSDSECIALLPERKVKRFLTSRYITSLLKSLYEGLPLPAIPEFGNPAIEKKIEITGSAIREYYQKYKSDLIF